MGYATCSDCGCRIRSGYCTNCQEEAYIMDVQAVEFDMEFSPEFVHAADEQRKHGNKTERKKR